MKQKNKLSVAFRKDFRLCLKAFLTLFIVFSLNFSLSAQIKLDNSYFVEDGITYSVVFPINYNKNKKYPLAIGLHGLGGDGSRLIIPFSYYSRYMNMILVCPDGNIPDGKNGVKWGYDKSEKYILSLVDLIKQKYKVYDDIFLFGFSQGGNQGLQMALGYPEMFRYFAGLSGGYTSLTDRHFNNAGKVNILFVSGDTGDGEVYTKREMDSRFAVLKKYNPYAMKKVFAGMKHDFTHEEAYEVFSWYLKVSNRDTKGYSTITGDYFKSYSDSIVQFNAGKYDDSIRFAKESLQKNKSFAPAYMNMLAAYFYKEDLENFKRHFYPTLEMYSKFGFFDHAEPLKLIENLKLSPAEFLSKGKFQDYLNLKLPEFSDRLSELYLGEVHLLIGELCILEQKNVKAKEMFRKAVVYYQKLNSKESYYQDAQVKRKIAYLTEYIKELEILTAGSPGDKN